MIQDPTKTHLDWRQLPLIIITGLIIGALFGQVGAALAQYEHSKLENLKLHKAAKRAG
ncbi:hypothetical protein [Microvirga calopogonii]|uniref:hypothetical protein n=1 Tax=Microvirga calopogonii TaxID=2078013 RepID=UPI0013B40F66|nr:hypothetical protein [Microvirga calopogonii]